MVTLGVAGKAAAPLLGARISKKGLPRPKLSPFPNGPPPTPPPRPSNNAGAPRPAPPAFAAPPPPRYAERGSVWGYGRHGVRYRVVEDRMDRDGCTLAESPVYMPDGRVDRRFVRVCPDDRGRYHIVD